MLPLSLLEPSPIVIVLQARIDSMCPTRFVDHSPNIASFGQYGVTLELHPIFPPRPSNPLTQGLQISYCCLPCGHKADFKCALSVLAIRWGPSAKHLVDACALQSSKDDVITILSTL